MAFANKAICLQVMAQPSKISQVKLTVELGRQDGSIARDLLSLALPQVGSAGKGSYSSLHGE
jgi:hypothetical protein